MRERAGAAVSDDEVRLARENRRDERRDVGGVVLKVGVEVDDDVGAHGERLLEPGGERGGEAAVRGQPHDAVGSVPAGHIRGAVGRAVVDDENLDF